MAFSGVHICFNYAGTKWNLAKQLSVLGAAISSQTMTTAGTSTIMAPVVDELDELPLMTITAAVDIYFAVGVTPDASQATGSGDTARTFLRSGDVYSVRVAPGAKVAWVAA